MWRIIGVSSRGTSHLRANLPCQDACAYEVISGTDGEPVLVAAVADGAGSACRAELASRIACRRAVDEVSSLLRDAGSLRELDRQACGDCLAAVRGELATIAEEEGLGLREYASTLLVAVAGAERAVFFQIGDGAIVIRDEDGYRCVFWPAKGEYANTTYFATDLNAQDYLQWDELPRPVDEIALFSDGLERLALRVAERAVHEPFFRSKMAILAATPESSVDLLSERLRELLDSPEVAARTDDDKTLVLASRCRERGER